MDKQPHVKLPWARLSGTVCADVAPTAQIVLQKHLCGPRTSPLPPLLLHTPSWHKCVAAQICTSTISKSGRMPRKLGSLGQLGLLGLLLLLFLLVLLDSEIPTTTAQSGPRLTPGLPRSPSNTCSKMCLPGSIQKKVLLLCCEQIAQYKALKLWNVDKGLMGALLANTRAAHLWRLDLPPDASLCHTSRCET